MQNPAGTAKLNIIDHARSIIVTNRKLLFERYQPRLNQNDVSLLLESVYAQAWVFDGEVFYVELYDDDARDWDQDVDYSSEDSANTVAVAIDEQIDAWYGRLTARPHWWETLRPEFLLIVGGDEIVPFYRADDRSYGDAEQQVHIDDVDPVGRVPQEHYMLSDNIYADVGGDKDEWEKGELELSVAESWAIRQERCANSSRMRFWRRLLSRMPSWPHAVKSTWSPCWMHILKHR